MISLFTLQSPGLLKETQLFQKKDLNSIAPLFSLFFPFPHTIIMVTKTLTSKAFIFDLDGTIIDTTPLVIKFWTNLALQNNLNPQEVWEKKKKRD